MEKHALVIGASGGIGHALANELAAREAASRVFPDHGMAWTSPMKTMCRYTWGVLKHSST